MFNKRITWKNGLSVHLFNVLYHIAATGETIALRWSEKMSAEVDIVFVSHLIRAGKS